MHRMLKMAILRSAWYVHLVNPLCFRLPKGWRADEPLLQAAGDVSDTTSVMSSIFKYREENGRTYHAYKDRTGAGSGEYIRRSPC
jgi:hypothetical protein